MEGTEFQAYLDKRYYPQIEWYDMKAIWNQKVYNYLQWGIIILAAITPVFIAISESWGKAIPIVLSSLVAIVSASLKTFKYQENWIHYRTTCETLRKEIHYYLAKIDEYGDADDPIGRFVKRVEALISRENTLWLTVQKKKEDRS